MTGKKKPESGDGSEHADGRSLSLATQSAPQSQSQSKKPAKTKTAPQQPPQQQPVLVICRNKHWKYISSFHGPWLQLPPEILETIANANYNSPRPRPIDPAVFFDLVKIRRLVDDATDLSVRAASGVTSIGQRSLPFGASYHAAALGFGFGLRPPPQAKLSPERKHRMREQAAQKLAKAYRLDEIACSVATMQSASSLEEVASLVLQRNTHDPDAKYVHFFHEKIPSRQLAECTSLTPLNEIVAARPSDPEPLRTRAMVRVFKGDLQGAVEDFTEALKLHRLYHSAHKSPRPTLQEAQQQQGTGRRPEDIILKPDDQPSSLDLQLLFQRAGVYLAIACRHVAAALPHPTPTPRGPVAAESNAENGNLDGGTQSDVDAEQPPTPKLSPTEHEAQRKTAEARKLVRQNAKRALRDYTAYLSHFEYSPDLPIEIAEDFTRKVNSAVNGARAPRSQSYQPGPRSPLAGEGEGPNTAHRVFALSDLFTSSPPTGLPPYPSMELASTRQQQPPSPGPVQTTTETLTCHPLLTDSLHSLLLCHCLIQTSAKELLRHAYMVARLARLADGYPVFQSSRCPARADWAEVLRSGGNWIQLAGSWEDLCAPTPLPLFQSTGGGATPVPASLPPPKQSRALPAPGDDSAPSTPGSPSAPTHQESDSAAAEAEKQRKDRANHQAIFDAVGDDRVNDESSLRLAIRARQLRAEHEYRLEHAVAALDAKLTQRELGNPPPAGVEDGPDKSALATAEPAPAPNTNNPTINGTTNGTVTKKPPTSSPTPTPTPRHRPSAFDNDRDYPISTERATAIARWVLEAPASSVLSSTNTAGASNGGKRKKKTAVKKKITATSATGVPLSLAAGVGGVVCVVDGDGDGKVVV